MVSAQPDGSATHRDQGSRIGFEPDTRLYVTNLNFPVLDESIAIPRDPAPDLIIQAEIPDSLIDKTAAYAAVGCREGWLYRDGRVSIHTLTDRTVRGAGQSKIFPGRVDWAPFVEWARVRARRV